MSQELIASLLLQLPLVAAIFFALWKKILVQGSSHDEQIKQMEKDHDEQIAHLKEGHARELAAANAEIAFREQLRQEAIVDKRAAEDREQKGREALKELSDVVRNTLDFQERLVEEGIRRSAEDRAAAFGTGRRRGGTRSRPNAATGS